MTSYKQLRAGDVTGGAVYRITVRQLEALIRLSEAHARIRCSDVIQPRDVREVRHMAPSMTLAVCSLLAVAALCHCCKATLAALHVIQDSLIRVDHYRIQALSLAST